MGLLVSRIVYIFSRKLTVECGSQTTTKFTEKLTNFNTVDLSSAEMFDQACDICDLSIEKEAVGYCSVCEHYMCFKCCKHHEKISLSQNHKIVGKDEFENVTRRKPLFGLPLIPLLQQQLPECSYCTKNYNTLSKCYHTIFLLLLFCEGKHTYLILWYDRKIYELQYITEKARCVKIQKMTNYKEAISSANKKIIKYFVHKGSNHICLVYCDEKESVFYKEAFTVNGQCYGVVPFGNGLAICLYIRTGFSLPDWQVQYVDFSGNIKKQIYYDSKGKPLFQQPAQMASNFNNDILFVSDEKANTVIALDLQGEVIYTFNRDSLKLLTGLTCDEDNNVYVACGKNVIQINKHGKKSRVILQSTSKNITHLCYNKQSRNLAVAEANGTVTLFTFFTSKKKTT